MNSSYKIFGRSRFIDIQIFDDKTIVAALQDGSIKVAKEGLQKDYRMQNLSGQKHGGFRSFEKDGITFFAFLTEESKKLVVYDFSSKTQVLGCSLDSQILFLEVDYSGELILFYTADFKLNLFEVSSGRVLSSVFIEKEFVPSKICFNSDLSRVALVSDGGQGYVCSPSLLKLQGSFTASGYDACYAGFLDEKTFVSVSKEGQIIAVDTDIMKTTKYNMRFSSFCKKGFFVNDNLLFLSIYRDGGFGIFNMELERTVRSGKLDIQNEVLSAKFDEKNLLLAVEDIKNILYIYDISALFSEFKRLFSKKDFFACYRLIEENELLVLTDAARMLEDVFSAFAMSALKMAENENYDGAIKQLAPFSKVSQKRNELKEIVESIETMRSFIGFIKSRKFANAYNLAERYKYLKLSMHYKSMEDEWKALIEKAKTLLMAGKIEDAKECFSVFRGVGSKTETIKQMLSERETINLFLKKLSLKDFKSAFDLAERYPFLKEIKEYKILKELGEKGMQKAQSLLKEGELQKAVDAVSALKSIPIYRQDAEALERKIAIYKKYFSYKQAGDEMKARIMAKKYPFLEEPLYCEL